MLFSHSILLADWYWGEKKLYKWFYWGLIIFSILFIIYGLSAHQIHLLGFLFKLPWGANIVMGLKKIQDHYYVIFSVLQILAMFFGFGIAFVGSQSIQYSLTKILLRYKYIQILSICLLLPLIYSFVVNCDFLIIILTVLWTLFLYIHTFFLIDKVFDPEELIVDVIAPAIIQFENRITKKYSGIYEIVKEWRNKPKPLIYNEAILFTAHSNAELDAYYKATRRLIKSGSLKLHHLLNILYGRIKDNNLEGAKFHESYKKDCDIKTYIWFLISHIIHNISEIASNNKEYHYLHEQLLLQIIMRIFLKEGNYTKKGEIENYFFSSLEKHSDFFTSFDFKNRPGILDNFITGYLDKDDENFVPNKNEQIAKLAQRLTGIFVFAKIKKHLIDEVEELKNEELIYLFSLFNLSNNVYDKLDELYKDEISEQEEFTRQFLIAYTGLLPFALLIDDKTQFFPDFNTNPFYEYIEKLFLNKRSIEFVKQFINGQITLVILEKEESNTIMKKSLEHLLSMETVSDLIKESIRRILGIVK